MSRARLVAAASGVVLVLAGLPAAHADLIVGPDVNISRATGYQGEVAIAVDPTNPSRLFAFSNNQQAGGAAALFGAYSTDGGSIWTTRLMATGTDISAACCDPSAQFDRFGNLFITYLDNNVGVNVAISTNGGQSFSNVAQFTARDQPTIVAGPSNIAGHSSTWLTYLNTSGSIAARSLDVTGLGAFGVLSAEQVAPGSTNGNGNFGDIVVGPSGQTVVTYQNPVSGIGPSTIFTHLDADGLGAGGFGPSRTATTTNVGGFAPIPAQPSRTIDSEVGLAYDTSGGPHNGRLYMVYTERPSTASSDTNIMLRYSDDDGATWSAAVVVNDDASARSQFFPRMSVDPVTGHVSIVWYDARNVAANNAVQVFGTMSLDSGLSFLPNVLIGTGVSSALLQTNPNQFGDYIGLTSYNDVFYAAWTDNSNSTGDNPDAPRFDIYTTRVQFIAGTVPEPTSIALVAVGLAAFGFSRRKRIAT